MTLRYDYSWSVDSVEVVVEQQVEVVALDKDRVVVETAMRLDVAVAGLVGEGLAGLPACLAAHVCCCFCGSLRC